MLNEVIPAADRSTANGSTTVFAYTWRLLTKTDIEVLVDLVVKTVDVDYTVDGLGNSGGGNVTFLSAPANGTIVTRLRKQPASQTSDYQANEAHPAERIEKDLDKLAMQIQQVKEQLRRGMFLPKSSSLADQGLDAPVVGSFARGKTGGGIDWATPTNAGPLSSPVAIADGGTGATTAAGARTNLLVYSENTLIDAKGDLLVGASDNTLARLAPPTTTGFVPLYDPSAANNLSWGPRTQDNPIINGNMEVWQRGTTFVADSTNIWTADRWRWQTSIGMLGNLSRSTNVPSVASAGVLFNYSFEVDVTTADASIAAGDRYSILTRIEGHNWRHFAQRQFTLSFWASSTKTGIHCVAFRNGASADRSYVAEYTVNVADTWEYKTVTVSASPSAGTWDYTNGLGLEVAFTLAAGSTYQTTANAWQTGNFLATSSQVNAVDSAVNFFRLTGVKLELGSVATPIQFRSFQDELAMCKRYYQKSFNYATTPAQNVGTSTGEYRFNPSVAGAVGSAYAITLPVSMRTSPTTSTTYNPSAANAQVRNYSDVADFTSTSISASGEAGLVVNSTGTAGTALGESLAVHWTAEAEL